MGLPSEVYHGLRRLFLEVDEFSSNQRLSDFVHSLDSLRPWVYGMSESGSLSGRIDMLIAYFHNKNRAMIGNGEWYDGRNALEIFLIELALAYANNPEKARKAPAELRRMMQLIALTPELQVKMHPLLTDGD